METTPSLDALATYVVLGSDGRASTVAGGDRFWSDLASGKLPEVEQGTLVAAFHSEGSFGAWEMHPQGEELVLLVSGKVNFLLEREGQRETVELRTPASFVLVPRGTWHMAEALEPSTMLFITYGAGTQHR